MASRKKNSASDIEKRVEILVNQYKEILSFEQAIYYFAFYKVMNEEAMASIAKIRGLGEAFAVKSIERINVTADIGAHFIDESESLALQKNIAEQKLVQLSHRATQRAIHAADARYNRPGGARDKRQQIQMAWASGKYTSRDRCAEEECGALNMSFSAARKALRNTPDP